MEEWVRRQAGSVFRNIFIYLNFAFVISNTLIKDGGQGDWKLREILILFLLSPLLPMPPSMVWKYYLYSSTWVYRHTQTSLCLIGRISQYSEMRSVFLNCFKVHCYLFLYLHQFIKRWIIVCFSFYHRNVCNLSM